MLNEFYLPYKRHLSCQKLYYIDYQLFISFQGIEKVYDISFINELSLIILRDFGTYTGLEIPSALILEARVVGGILSSEAAPFLPDIFQAVFLSALRIFSRSKSFHSFEE